MLIGDKLAAAHKGPQGGKKAQFRSARMFEQYTMIHWRSFNSDSENEKIWRQGIPHGTANVGLENAL